LFIIPALLVSHPGPVSGCRVGRSNQSPLGEPAAAPGIVRQRLPGPAHADRDSCTQHHAVLAAR